jgi:hypothetical protein
VNKMVCEDCLTIFYSAAARTLVERGDPCPNCSGRMILDEEDPPPLTLVQGGSVRDVIAERRVGERRQGERRRGLDRRRESSQGFPTG